MPGLIRLRDRVPEKTRFGSISKAGSPLLRFQLGLAAQQAARPSSPDVMLKSFYKRLAKKKTKAVAKTKVVLEHLPLNAAARKLLVKLSIMLRDNITAAEFDQRGRTVGNARLTQGSAMTVL